MKNILIIGGSRYLGRAVAENFIAAGGYDVFVMNRGNNPPCDGVAGTLVCDKNDRTGFAKILHARDWDVIVDTLLQEDDIDFLTDTVGADIGHYIHVGSIGVYGDARMIPAPEWLPLQIGDNRCDVVFNDKIRQDQALFRAWSSKRFPMSILRMGMIYGPGDVPVNGIGNRNPEYFNRIVKGEPVEIAENGRALIQPGEVRDLASAFTLCAERPETIGQVYNICGGYSLMLKDFVRMCAEILGAPEPRFIHRTAEELIAEYPDKSPVGIKFVCQHMCASIAKAERDLHWRPTTPLATGLADNFEWMRRIGKIDNRANFKTLLRR